MENAALSVVAMLDQLLRLSWIPQSFSGLFALPSVLDVTHLRF